MHDSLIFLLFIWFIDYFKVQELDEAHVKQKDKIDGLSGSSTAFQVIDWLIYEHFNSLFASVVVNWIGSGLDSVMNEFSWKY